jgi:hypothetical protein
VLRNALATLEIPGATTDPRQTILTWQGEHPEGKTLIYTVLISMDAGVTWRTVAVGLKEPILALSRGLLQGAVTKYKVIASDGFYTTEIVGDLR